MGFYNIFIEGQQAEEYKARKAAEVVTKKKEEDDHFNKRYGRMIQNDDDTTKVGNRYTPQMVANSSSNPNTEKGMKRDIERMDNAAEVLARVPEFKKLDTMTISPDEAQKKYGLTDREKQAIEILQSVRKGQTKYDSVNFDALYNDINNASIKIAKNAGMFTTADAINKHMRRHPDQWDGDKRIKTRSESGIFESVEFLND